MVVIITMVVKINPANGTTNSTPFGGGTNNTTLFGGGANNSTLFGDIPTIATLFGERATNATLFGGGTNNSILFGGGTNNSTLFGGGTNNSTLFGGGTNNSTLFGGGTNNSTLFGGGTNNSTLFNDRPSIATLFGERVTNSTLFGEGIAKLYHQGIINSTLFGEGTTNQTPFREETANWTLLGGEDFVIEDVSKTPISEMTIDNPWLPYTMVTFACIFLLVGLLGNGMTLVVTLKSKTRFKPHNILIMSLAVADTLALLTNTLNIHAFSEVSLIDMQALKSANAFTCKLFNMTFRMSLWSSTLIIMLICIERFIVVWFPLKARHLLTKRLTIMSVVACVMAALVIGGIPSALYSGNVNGECYFGLDVDGDGDGDTMQTTPLLMIKPILFIVTPMLVILSLTPLTIAKLFYQQAIRRSLTNQETSTSTHRTSILLTAVVVFYLLLAGTPHLLFAVMSVRGTLISTTTGSWGVGRLFLTVIVQANYSTNFILYTVFNKEFRQNLFRMLGCSCC